MFKFAGAVLGVFISMTNSTLSQEVRAPQGESIRLGNVVGTVYHTVERDAFRVTATLASGESGTPIRFVATLAPGQKIVLSVPQEIGMEALSMEITRMGDQISVLKARKVVALD